MSNVLLGLWIALIGADRIDLAGGRGPFILTPFLALTPIVALSELSRRLLLGRRVEVNRGAIVYTTVSGALICVALTSVFVAAQLRVSAARVVLLALDIVGTLAIALLVSDRADLLRVLARGAIASLAVYAFFNVGEALWWISHGPGTLRFGPVLIKFESLQNVGPLPRLAGPVADGNRAGYVLLCYFAFIAASDLNARTRRIALTIAALFLMATVSRSAALGVIATLGIGLATGRARISPKVAVLVPLTVAAAALALLAAPGKVERVTAVIRSPVAERLTVTEGSASSHLKLVERGLHEATASMSRAAFGLGYGNSYLVLQDVFPGNRYGSFHSLFVSMFAEAGVLALLLSLVLYLAPLMYDSPWRALVAGTIAFNLFYQTNTEPVAWFVLALSWLAMRHRLPATQSYL